MHTKTHAFYFPEKKNRISLRLLKKKRLIHQSTTKGHKSSVSSSAATAYNTLGVRTRAQKRRTMMGERDVLWDVIVKNDDICFTHILPRLNRTDLKFLYEVNTETRKLVKRSSRVGDLKKRFDVSEMSSISTLEFVWENKSLWSGYLYDETYFCREVARTNKLELLKWAREEKECEWDRQTIDAAARQGNLEMVKYCVANKCPIDTSACACAAFDGQLKCLKYLHEEAKAPWDSDAVRQAHKNNQPECVQYLLDNDCPLPRGWSYEDGELHVPESESE